MRICIEADNSITPGEVIFELVQNNFLASGFTYSLLIGDNIDTATSADYNKSMKESGIVDGDTLLIQVAANAGESCKVRPEKMQSSDQQKAKRKQKTEQSDGDAQETNVKHMQSRNSEDSMMAILQNYVRILDENAQWRKGQELAYRNERARLENKVKSYEKELIEKRIAAIVLIFAEIIIGLGAAFMTKDVMQSVFTIAAGVLMTIVGLWLSFKKSK